MVCLSSVLSVWPKMAPLKKALSCVRQNPPQILPQNLLKGATVYFLSIWRITNNIHARERVFYSCYICKFLGLFFWERVNKLVV